MKNPRTVIVTLEIRTKAPLKDLKSKDNWQDAVDLLVDEDYPQVKQVTVTVAQAPRRT